MTDEKDTKSKKLLYCSFCGKSEHEVKKLVAGNKVYICDKCIDLCKDIMVDEDLPNFFTAVRLQQADEIVKETQNLKDNYGIEIEDPRVINILDMTTMPKKPI